MDVGPRRTRFAPSLLVCTLVAMPLVARGQAEPAAPDALSTLMQRLAATVHEHENATFVERQYIAVLKAPIESSGELKFVAPDHLEKRTTKPTLETLVVDKGTITITRGSRTQSVALRSYPQLAVFIESIRATLSGNQQALEQTYHPEVRQAAGSWTLTLAPRDPKLAAIVKLIRISGKNSDMQLVETIRADGDRSEMEITPAPGT